MPSAVSRSRMPNSFSRSRSSMMNSGESRARPPRSRMSSRGLLRAQVGRGQHDVGPLVAPASRRTSGRARAPARSPSGAERHVDVALGDVDARAGPAASAASRATLPALSPWRTIHNRSGQRFCIGIRPPCFMEDNAGGGQKHRRSAGVWAMIFLRSRSSRPAFKRGVIAGAAPCGPGRRSRSGLRRQVQSQASTWRCCRSALHARFHPSCGSS